LWGKKGKKNKKAGNHKVSRPEQERNAINRSLLSVQNIIPKGKKKYMVVFNAEVESEGRGYAERRPHFRMKWGRRRVRKR
jgi:hypothetical protein